MEPKPGEMSFITEHPDLEMMESGKYRCKLTGHEMLPQQAVVEAHLKGKKYSKAKAMEKVKQYDFAKHLPHIVENKRDPRKLFCHRTKLHLNKVPEEVETHVNGRRFRARMNEWEEKQKRRAAKLARTKDKADARAARKAALSADGSDNEEDPVLAKFAGIISDDDDDELNSDDDDDVRLADSDDDCGSGGEEEHGRVGKGKISGKKMKGGIVRAITDDGIIRQMAHADEEMDQVRSAKEHYTKGLLAAKAQARQQTDQKEDDGEGSDFEVVTGAQSCGSEDDGMESEPERPQSDSESEDLTDAKKLSMARIAARKQRNDRDDVALKRAPTLKRAETASSGKPRGSKAKHKRKSNRGVGKHAPDTPAE
jgi:hypothetical protein